MHPLLASFLELEDREGAETLREAAEQRRFGKRTMQFNCFEVVIDAEAGTVTLEDSIDLDRASAVVSLDELVRDLRDVAH